MPARNRETRPYTAPQARTVGLRFPNWTRFRIASSIRGCGERFVMAGFIAGADRDQPMLLPALVDDYITADAAVGDRRLCRQPGHARARLRLAPARVDRPARL